MQIDGVARRGVRLDALGTLALKARLHPAALRRRAPGLIAVLIALIVGCFAWNALFI